jgi:hypothetical protein
MPPGGCIAQRREGVKKRLLGHSREGECPQSWGDWTNVGGVVVLVRLFSTVSNW